MKKITNEILEERIKGQELLTNQKFDMVLGKLDEMISQIKIQNGRVTKNENKLNDLEKWKAKAVGMAVGASALASAVFKKIF